MDSENEKSSLNKSVIVKLLTIIIVVIAIIGLYLFLRSGDGIIKLPFVGERIFVCGESEVSDFEGNRYGTVQIGEQCWTSENLKSEKDRNGKRILRDCYNDNPQNCEFYGGLYDWKTANLICPEGWVLPTDDDFKEMEVYLGMDEDEADLQGWRESGGIERKIMVGGKSGFDALMAGHFDSHGEFKTFGSYTFFWTSTPFGDLFAFRRYISTWDSGIVRNVKEQNYGFSVRCIQL